MTKQLSGKRPFRVACATQIIDATGAVVHSIEIEDNGPPEKRKDYILASLNALVAAANKVLN